MSIITIITMIFIPGVVWGGLVYFLSLAIKKEKQKSGNG